MPRTRPVRRPAMTDEGREGQLVTLAIDLVEKQLRDGTASSQVITHYLKLGSTREKLEQQRLKEENTLLRSKVKAMESGQNIERLYAEALQAMRSYSPDNSPVEEDEDVED